MRTIQGIPEIAYSIEDSEKYRIVNNTEPIGEGVTKEWYFTYVNEDEHWIDLNFIVHAKTIEAAFEHFISIKPKTLVKGIEYYGIYF